MDDTLLDDVVTEARCELATSTSGVARGDGYEVRFGGACPVQGYGAIDGHPCYFRARGEGWRVEVFAADSGLNEGNYVTLWCDAGVRPIFVYGDPDAYDVFEAGWITADKSAAHIAEAVSKFRASRAV